MSFSCASFARKYPLCGARTIGAHHRQRDMVANPGIFLGREQVRGRGAEELHRRIVERRRVRHVDDHRGSLQDLGQTLARERVHTGRGSGGDGVMTVFGQRVHQLRPHQACSPDYDDSHDEPFLGRDNFPTTRTDGLLRTHPIADSFLRRGSAAAQAGTPPTADGHATGPTAQERRASRGRHPQRVAAVRGRNRRKEHIVTTRDVDPSRPAGPVRIAPKSIGRSHKYRRVQRRPGVNAPCGFCSREHSSSGRLTCNA